VKTGEAEMPRIRAGRDALTNAELTDARKASLEAFNGAIKEKLASPSREAPQKRPRLGVARLTHCTLDAGVGRKHTGYRARCFARLEMDGVALVEVEGNAIRKTRSRALPPGQAREAARRQRNPLLSADHAKKALMLAAQAAARQLIDPPTSIGSPADRAALLQALSRENTPEREAALLVDLSTVALDPDGEVFWSRLGSEHDLIRRAALHGLVELCPPGLAEAVEKKPELGRGEDSPRLSLALQCSEALAPLRQ
jgi:hypothetical protein